MPTRLKAQYLTEVGKQCIGSLGNGTKASIAVEPPHLFVSGEQIPCQKVLSNTMASRSLH